MERDKGLFRLLKIPFFYNSLMHLLGSKSASKWIFKNFFQLKGDEKIIDIGCGPGSFFENYSDLLPSEINYFGIDPSKSYIKKARQKYGKIAQFYCGVTSDFISEIKLNDADIVMCNFVLHHLNDDEVLEVLDFVRKKLVSGTGRFLSIEPVHLLKQYGISSFVMNQDRGIHIRNEAEWKKLMHNSHLNHDTNIISGLIRIPYNYILMEAKVR